MNNGGGGTGDKDLYIMADVKNRCAGDNSVVFAHHFPWLIVVCTLSGGLVMHKHAHKHANISKHTCMFTHNHIPEHPRVREKREHNTAKSKGRRATE